jgi:hypothetical protein
MEDRRAMMTLKLLEILKPSSEDCDIGTAKFSNLTVSFRVSNYMK